MTRLQVWNQIKKGTPVTMYGFKQKTLGSPLFKDRYTPFLVSKSDEVKTLRDNFASMLGETSESHTVFKIETEKLGTLYVSFENGVAGVGRQICNRG